MVVPRNFHLLVAATLVCGLLMITYVSKTVNRSRMVMLSVSGVEKVQHLDNQISKRLANEELAKWDKLEAKIFPSDSDKTSSVSKKTVTTHQLHTPVVSKPIPKKAAVFFGSGSGKYSTDSRFHHVAPVVPQPKQAHTQKKAMEPVAAPKSSLGDEVMELPSNHGGEDEGDVHVPGDSVNRYMFKSKNGQNALARHASDAARVTMPVKAAKVSAKVEVKRQQLGFLGEGPWAHVKEGDAHHPNGGGGEFFGRDSKLQKDGGVDGQGGIIVDRWMWDPAAQKSRGPPCHAKCDKPEGCDGHEALSDGDCDELMLRDGDLDKDPSKIGPATYDAYTGNTHGLFKSHRIQTLHAQRRGGARVVAPVPTARAVGLAPLDRHTARRPPGLGIFAPTAALKQRAVFEELSTVPEVEPWEAESHARVDAGGFHLHPRVLEAINATNGTALGDEIVDGALDQSITPDVVEPYMYKDGAARRSVLRATRAAARPAARRPSPLGDEVLDGLNDDTRVVQHRAARGPTATRRISKPHPAAAAAPRAARAMSPHAMFLAATAAAPAAAAPSRRVVRSAAARALAEPNLDGLRDEEVPTREAAASERGRDNWKTFFAPHRAAAAARPAAPERRAAAAAAVVSQQLLTVGEHAALVKAGHANSSASTSTSFRCPGGGTTGNTTQACGDETVDPLAGEAVHVQRDEVHADPKEVNIYSFFSARKAPAAEAAPAAGARHAFKDREGLHHGLTDLAARQDLDQMFASLPGGLPSDE